MTVTGSYTCAPFASNGGTVDLSITQGTGGSAVNGSGFVDIAVCNGVAQRYRTTVWSNDGRRFKTGAATAVASGCGVRHRRGRRLGLPGDPGRPATDHHSQDVN